MFNQGGVKMVGMAMKKLYLQWLQVQYVKKGNNETRSKEEKEVFRYLLSHPGRLILSERLNDSEQYAKQLNVLTSNVKNARLYELTKKRLKNV